MNRRVLTLVALVLLAGLARWQMKAVDVAPPESLDSFPMGLGRWRGSPAQTFSNEVLAALGVDDHLNRSYVAEGMAHANVYVGYYRSQQQGASIHSPLNCLPGAGWEPVTVERVPFARGAARLAFIRKGSEHLLVMYWYQTATRVEGDEYRGRLYTVIDTLRYGRNDAALVRVIVPVDSAAGGESRAIQAATELGGLAEREVARVLFRDSPEAPTLERLPAT